MSREQELNPAAKGPHMLLHLYIVHVTMLASFLAKLAFGQRTAHASTTDKMHSVQTGQAGYKQKDCQTLPRQGKMVFQIFLPLKMVCQVF